MPILSNFPAGAKQSDASATTKGITKIYDEVGTNTDGAMTQRAASEAFVEKESTKQVEIVEIPSVDDSLSATSTNPVQNKVVKAALDEHDESENAHAGLFAGKVDLDSGSSVAFSLGYDSGGVYIVTE